MNLRHKRKQIKKMTLFVKNRSDYHELDRSSSSKSRWINHKRDLRADYDNCCIKVD